MIKWLFWLAMCIGSMLGGYFYGKSQAEKKAALVMQLDEIARRQAEALKRKAYLLVMRNKRDAYFASDDKVDEYVKKNHKKIERIWTCQK